MVTLGEKVAAQGLDGFYLTGSTGECFLQSSAEQKEVAEVMISAFRDRMIIIAHIGEKQRLYGAPRRGTRHSCGLFHSADLLPLLQGGDSRLLHQNCGRDLYSGYPIQLPGSQWLNIDSDDIRSLRKKSDRFTGIKFTLSALNQIITMKRSFPDFTVYNGYDELFLGGLSFGSLYRQLFAVFQSEEMEKARCLQREANRIIEVVARIGINGALKHILSRKGIAAGVWRKSFSPLADGAKRELDRLYEDKISFCFLAEKT